ncbi:hypothetical protein CHARACLAT_014581 [Characodon lateralis]|uniref:Uncharacterized protein n=1 Tax=Characodon lateralis TaxID=208331 RepID=A0ABU7D6R9_9TELE|nr:hypothetical protein [Characodon lateralis]
MSKEAELDVRSNECDTVPAEPSRDLESPRPPPTAKVPEHTGGTAGVGVSIPSRSQSHLSNSSGGGGGLGGVSIVSNSSAEGAGESSMQFSTRPPSAEQPGFMGTWQQQSTDSNLLYRMSQQGAVTRLPLKGDRSTMGRDLEECVGSGSMCVRVRGEVSLGWPDGELEESRVVQQFPAEWVSDPDSACETRGQAVINKHHVSFTSGLRVSCFLFVPRRRAASAPW